MITICLVYIIRNKTGSERAGITIDSHKPTIKIVLFNVSLGDINKRL